jgi:ABC-2 type transport system permease protein
MKTYRKSILIWSVCLVIYFLLSVNKLNALDSAGQDMNKFMEGMPRAIKAIMGGDLDISTSAGYYGVCLVYVFLMGAIHAVLLGANIIAKEEQEKTVEFLMVKPVTRTKILLSKLSATLTNILIFNLVSLGVGLWFFQKFESKTFDTNDLIMVHFGLFLTQLIFMAIGNVVAAINQKSRTAGSISMGILLTTYFLSILVALSEKIDFLKYITPFKYFEVAPIVHGESWGFEYYVISLFIIIGCLISTFVFYKKRDLKV